MKLLSTVLCKRLEAFRLVLFAFSDFWTVCFYLFFFVALLSRVRFYVSVEL